MYEEKMHNYARKIIKNLYLNSGTIFTLKI
jgi:hypothetical protein